MENKASIWDLIKSDLFEQACSEADVEFSETGNVSILRNKTYALFNLEKYDDIVKLGYDIIALDGTSAGDYIFLGIALWILNKKDDAVSIWKQAIRLPYQDASGGLDQFFLLYFSAIKLADKKLKQEAIKGTKKLSKTKSNINWPGPLAHYLLDEINEFDILKYIDDDIPVLRERQLCQMDFIIAIKCLEEQNLARYKVKLEDSISYGVNSYLQKFLYLAKSELKKINA